MLLSYRPGIFNFHWSHTSVWWCQDDKIWGEARDRAGDADQVKGSPARPLPGSFLPDTAPLRHKQALVHNWLKIGWGGGAVIICSLKTSG